jgi:hypothetical protein
MFSKGRHHCENFSHENMNHAKNVLYFIHENLVGPILKDSLHKSSTSWCSQMNIVEKSGFISCVPKMKPLLNSRSSKS